MLAKLDSSAWSAITCTWRFFHCCHAHLPSYHAIARYSGLDEMRLAGKVLVTMDELPPDRQTAARLSSLRVSVHIKEIRWIWQAAVSPTIQDCIVNRS